MTIKTFLEAYHTNMFRLHNAEVRRDILRSISLYERTPRLTENYPSNKVSNKAGSDKTNKYWCSVTLC